MKRQFGLIGFPLGHSASQTYFTSKFQNEGIDDAEFNLYELESIDDLPQLLREKNLSGFTVTIPHKLQIIQHLSSLSTLAEQIGSVNCVRCEPSGLVGHNTDYIGLKVSVEKLLDGATPHSAIILGTGGVSQTVQFLMAQMGIPYHLVSRDPMKSDFTYDNLPCDVVAESHLIINTTPVGMYPNVDDAPRIPYAYITPSHFLLDLIYNPAITSFMDYGNQRGAKTMGGGLMFSTQAEAAWEIWNR